MEILEKILGGKARVKIMRLFLLNKDKNFKNTDIVKRSKVASPSARKELRLLLSAGFIRKNLNDWRFNSAFKYTKEFEDLLISSDTLNKTEIGNAFKHTGKIKLFLISGRFIKKNDSRVDLLIVGDKLKRGMIEKEIRKLEAEMGVELTYAIFDTKEFNYRLSMYDKLVRDVLDFPHEIILQHKELSTETLKRG